MNPESIDVSVIVVNWNTRDLLHQCLHSIQETMGELAVEVLVVDNASVDGSQGMVRRCFPRTRLIQNRENVGFVRANNQALEACRGRYVLLLNSDTEILPGSLHEAVRFMDAHPAAGLAGGLLLNGDGSFQASYTLFPTLWREFLVLSRLGRWLVRPSFPSYGPRADEGPRQIEGYMEGAYLLARREAVDQVGGLDERIFMYAEDVDWCYRFYRAGWEVWYLPQAPIIHYGGQSSGKRRERMEAELYRSRVYFFRKHYGAAAAFSLKVLIYAITLIKIAVHGVLRFISSGHAGRSVTGWQELHLALSSVDSGFKERIES